jgi:hypothetical protein
MRWLTFSAVRLRAKPGKDFFSQVNEAIAQVSGVLDHELKNEVSYREWSDVTLDVLDYLVSVSFE